MVNCQMMGIQPSEAKALPWQEYQARLWIHNDRHTVEDERADAPDAEYAARQMELLERRGIARSLH